MMLYRNYAGTERVKMFHGIMKNDVNLIQSKWEFDVISDGATLGLFNKRSQHTAVSRKLGGHTVLTARLFTTRWSGRTVRVQSGDGGQPATTPRPKTRSRKSPILKSMITSPDVNVHVII